MIEKTNNTKRIQICFHSEFGPLVRRQRNKWFYVVTEKALRRIENLGSLQVAMMSEEMITFENIEKKHRPTPKHTKCQKCGIWHTKNEIKFFRGEMLCGMCTLGDTNDELVAQTRDDFYSNGAHRIEAAYHVGRW